MFLSSRLQELRKLNNITQAEIAKHCGVTERGYRNFEKGQNIPNAAVIIKLCNYYNVSADYLLGLSDDPRQH